MDINANKHIKLFIDDSDDMEKMAKCCYALASTDRIRILKGIMYYPKSISTLSNETGIPISTVSRYAKPGLYPSLISPVSRGTPSSAHRKRFRAISFSTRSFSAAPTTVSASSSRKCR